MDRMTCGVFQACGIEKRIAGCAGDCCCHQRNQRRAKSTGTPEEIRPSRNGKANARIDALSAGVISLAAFGKKQRASRNRTAFIWAWCEQATTRRCKPKGGSGFGFELIDMIAPGGVARNADATWAFRGASPAPTPRWRRHYLIRIIASRSL